MRYQATRVVTALICLSGSSHVLADWQDWWQTPEQQAAEAFEQGDHERLLQQAPDAGWAGLGHYQAGDFDAAAQAFAERAGQLQQQGDVKAANRALYNQGVSDVRAGRYDEALEQFETVLDSDPTFADAAFNRDIARQLKELQQQQQQPQQGDEGEPGEGEGESGDDSEQNQQGDSGDQDSSADQEQPSDAEASNDGDQESGQDPSAESQSEEQRGSESGESPEEGQQPSGSQTGNDLPGESEAERQAAAEAAQRALDAEAQQAEEEVAAEGRFGSEDVDERPLSESEQAAEQLLRRIPDDPAGLLRRRLEQSHRNEYPEVRDGREAW